MDNGWIKLHRKLLSSYTWTTSTPEQKVIMITLLLMANHEEKEWKWKGQRYQARPGEFITSLPSIKEKCGKGITIKQIRTALLKFEDDGFLSNESTRVNRKITITNWDSYQISSEDTINQRADKRADDKSLESIVNTGAYSHMGTYYGSHRGSPRADEGQTEGRQNSKKGQTKWQTDMAHEKEMQTPMNKGFDSDLKIQKNDEEGRQKGRQNFEIRNENVQDMASNKKTRNNNNNIKDILSSKPGKEIPFKEIIDYLNSKAEKNYKASTDKTKSCIKARYNEGFKKEDFIKVIDNKCKEWKGDPKMDRYLRPETLFGPKFESYLNERPISTKPVQPIQNKTRQPSMSERDFDDDYFEQFYDYALNANLDDIMNPKRKE